MDDAELVAAARKGNAAAFEDLVRRTGRAVYARIYLETADPHLAEDLVQETFLKAWREIRTLADPNGFRTWILAIAHNVVIDAARRRLRKKRDASRNSAAIDVAALKDSAPGPDQSAAQDEEAARVLALLRQLPDEYRQVVAMRYLLGEDYDTIGRQLGISNGSLRGLLSRGMSLLKEKYLKLENRRTP